MYQEQQSIEKGKARIIGEFYYSLTLLQAQAVKYVASGKTDDDKLRCAQEITELVRKTGAEIEHRGGDIPNHSFEHCDPPCRGDKLVMMCICDGGDVISQD